MSAVPTGCRIGGQADVGDVVHNFLSIGSGSRGLSTRKLSLGSMMGGYAVDGESNSEEKEPSGEAVSCKSSLSWSGDLKHKDVVLESQRG